MNTTHIHTTTINNEFKCFRMFLIKLIQENLWQHIIKYLNIRELIKLRITSKSYKRLVEYEAYRYLCLLEKQLAYWDSLAQIYIASYPSSSIFNVHKTRELKSQLQAIFHNESSLFKKSLSEFVKLPNPPMIIQHILIALIYLTNTHEKCQQVKDPSKWENYKLILSDSRYKMTLGSMSIANIQTHSIDKVEELMKDLTLEQIIKNSRSLATLYNAIVTMKDFAKVYKEIENDVNNKKYYINILQEKDKSCKKFKLFKSNYTKIVPLKSLIPRNLNIAIIYKIFEFLIIKEIMSFRQTCKANYSFMKHMGLNMMKYADAKMKNMIEEIELIKQNIPIENQEILKSMAILQDEAVQIIQNIDKKTIMELRFIKAPPLSILNIIKAVTLLSQRAEIVKFCSFKWPGILLCSVDMISNLVKLDFDKLTSSDILAFDMELDGITEVRASMASVCAYQLLIWGNKAKQYVELKKRLLNESEVCRNLIRLKEKIEYLKRNKRIFQRLNIKLE